MKCLALLSLLLLSAPVHGDGLPVDGKGAVTIPHTVIRLSASQKEEIQALGTVTLSDVQWADLRKVSPGTPKRLVGILPADYNDCTCGQVWGGILLSDGGVAVIHEVIAQDVLDHRIDSAVSLDLHVDARGQFHFEGSLIRFPMLLEALKACSVRKRQPGMDFFPARVSVPPGMRTDHPAFAERVKEVESLLSSKGWNRYFTAAPTQ